MAMMQANLGAFLGLLAGTSGILYGLTAKEFVSGGWYGFSSREPENVIPKWYHRALVVSVWAIVLLASVRSIWLTVR
jgi:hypothetical protein